MLPSPDGSLLTFTVFWPFAVVLGLMMIEFFSSSKLSVSLAKSQFCPRRSP